MLANGLDGHATVDQEQILTAALDAIEAPHIQVLDALRANTDAHAGVEYRDRKKLTLTNSEITKLLPGHEAVLGAVTQVLAGYHLIEPVETGLTAGVPRQTFGRARWLRV